MNELRRFNVCYCFQCFVFLQFYVRNIKQALNVLQLSGIMFESLMSSRNAFPVFMIPQNVNDIDTLTSQFAIKILSIIVTVH